MIMIDFHYEKVGKNQDIVSVVLSGILEENAGTKAFTCTGQLKHKKSSAEALLPLSHPAPTSRLKADPIPPWHPHFEDAPTDWCPIQAKLEWGSLPVPSATPTIPQPKANVDTNNQ